MSTQGTAVVNFGAGAAEATVVVSSAGVSGSSLVEAWPLCNESSGGIADDSAWVEQMQVFATYIVNGVGFTIIAKPMFGRAGGSYNVGWVYNP